jgi:hypothetical protein
MSELRTKIAGAVTMLVIGGLGAFALGHPQVPPRSPAAGPQVKQVAAPATLVKATDFENGGPDDSRRFTLAAATGTAPTRGRDRCDVRVPDGVALPRLAAARRTRPRARIKRSGAGRQAGHRTRKAPLDAPAGHKDIWRRGLIA